MKRYALAALAAAGIAASVPAVASAHWVGRSIYANGNAYNIHPHPITPASRGWEVFQSYGPKATFASDLLNESTGLAVCATGWTSPGVGVRRTYYCPTSTIGTNYRLRVQTAMMLPSWEVGFYMREMP